LALRSSRGSRNDALPDDEVAMVRHSWRTQLKAASDERHVVSLVARYRSEWTPAEIEQLPHGAWADAPDTARGIVDHSVRLAVMHAHMDPGAPALAALQQLLLFYTHAAVAVTRLTRAGMETMEAR
jgi:hypothetical protein